MVDDRLHPVRLIKLGTPSACAALTVSKVRRAEGMLAARQIAYRPSHQIVSVDAGHAQFSDGEAVPFDLLAYMPPITPPPVIAASALAGAGGWIEADRHTLRTTHENVYAIGDNVQMPLGIGKPLPRAGVFAHGQARSWRTPSCRASTASRALQGSTPRANASSRSVTAAPARFGRLLR